MSVLVAPTLHIVINCKGERFMNISIQARGFDLTEAIREHTRKRLQFALGWANHEVRSISVCLSDVNGPRGGNDKRCRIQIPIAGSPDVVIEDAESDLYLAINRAADRTERTMARRLARLRGHQRERISARVPVIDEQSGADTSSTTG